MNTIITQTIPFEDFSKIELKIGTILEVEEIEGAEKLLKLKIDLGEDEPRQVLAGVKQWYKPEDLVGKQVVVAANLEPRIMMGLESQGMVLMAGEEPVLLMPQKEVPAGTNIR